MKKITALLVLITSLNVSCKKDPDPQQLMFFPTISSPDVIDWDSIAYTTINYSDMSEINEEFYNPDIYNYSINMDVRTEYLTLDAGHTFVLKKFDMIGKSGKIMYYAPFSTGTSETGTSFKLPKPFKTDEGKATMSFPVIRYSE